MYGWLDQEQQHHHRNHHHNQEQQQQQRQQPANTTTQSRNFNLYYFNHAHTHTPFSGAQLKQNKFFGKIKPNFSSKSHKTFFLYENKRSNGGLAGWLAGQLG